MVSVLNLGVQVGDTVTMVVETMVVVDKVGVMATISMVAIVVVMMVNLSTVVGTTFVTVSVKLELLVMVWLTTVVVRIVGVVGVILSPAQKLLRSRSSSSSHNVMVPQSV